MAGFPRKGAYRVTPERNLREDDDVANRVGLSQTEDRGPALSCELLQGRAIRRVTLQPFALGPTTIAHRLGRQIVGWFVTRVGGVPPFAYPTEISADDNFLLLLNPIVIDQVVDLWVY